MSFTSFEKAAMKRKEPVGFPYHCPACKRIIYRDQDKGWIKSWCERKNRYARLMRVQP